MSASDLLQRLTERSSQAGLDVEPPVASRLVAYYALLEHWNRTINLTSLRNVDDAIDRLLLEPLAAARYLPSQSQLLDIGSGGGSPAIPLAIGLGVTSLVMVESNSRKAAFLREAVRELEMPARVEAARLESLSITRHRRPPTADFRASRQAGQRRLCQTEGLPCTDRSACTVFQRRIAQSFQRRISRGGFSFSFRVDEKQPSGFNARLTDVPRGTHSA